MRILLINFRMDPESPVLAWQWSVANKLAKRCSHLTVMTFGRGREGELQPNIDLHVVPRCYSKWPWRVLGAKYLMRMPVDVWCRRHQYDACFIHMNFEWAYLLAPVLRKWKVPVLLWYAHGTVTRGLRKALEAVDAVATSTPEGFRIASPKVHVIGQAIDTDLFGRISYSQDRDRAMYVGRVSPRKRLELLIDTIAAIGEVDPSSRIRLDIVGPVLNARDRRYLRDLEQRVKRVGVADRVSFLGPATQLELPSLYRNAFVHINVSATGSMDKTVMEALALGCPVLTSNDAIVPLLANSFPEMVIQQEEPIQIARQILNLYRRRHVIDAGALRQLVVGRHDLDRFVSKILDLLESISQRGRIVDGRALA